MIYPYFLTQVHSEYGGLDLLTAFSKNLSEFLLNNWQISKRRKVQVPGYNSSEINPEHYIRRSLLITRYLLFSLTSVFYLATPPFSPIAIKIIVVLSFLAAAVLAQNLYDSWDFKTLYQKNIQEYIESGSTSTRKEHIVPLKLIAIETVGVAFLILPTGGLDSHFVWYALNPIIAAVVYLPVFFCWGTVALFLGTAIGVSMFYPGFGGSPIHFMANHISELLVFIVTTSLAQVAISLARYLGVAYNRLAAAHDATERSLEHISSLYQALETFSTREDSAQLVDVLAFYSNKLCGENAACFLKKGIEGEEQDENNTILRIANQGDEDHGIDWEKELSRLWNQMKSDQTLMIHPLNAENGQIIAVPVISHGECFGLLAYAQPEKAKNQEEKIRSLTFLAGLAAIILERLKGDKLWARLLVSEEQNRIANEIHDGVSQYLFSMVCALDTISKAEAHLQEEKIQEQLKLVEETAARAARELRASIYKLSPHKRGESIFVDNLASYLDELGRLNGIQVDLQAQGSEEVLSPALRKALYRIVREASSNAVRHGKCTALNICLSMFPNQTVLEIKDNGCGYQPVKSSSSGNWENGLGNWNMHHLANRFNGDLEIESEPGRGTLIRCTIPKRSEMEDSFKEAVNK